MAHVSAAGSTELVGSNLDDLGGSTGVGTVSALAWKLSPSFAGFTISRQFSRTIQSLDPSRAPTAAAVAQRTATAVSALPANRGEIEERKIKRAPRIDS